MAAAATTCCGRAAWATGVGARAHTLSMVHLALRPQAEMFEDLTRDLAGMVDRILRKHGKNIIGKQLASRRLADVMIDLFVLACTFSRVTHSIEAKGVDAAAKEIDIARVLAGQVHGRVTRNFRKIDDNDDELVKDLATHAYEAEGYSWDTI